MSGEVAAPFTCRGPHCDVTIRRLAHEGTGNLAPIEAGPHPDGNILVLPEGRYRIVPASDRWEYAGMLRRNHFGFCVDAQRFGKRRVAR